MKKERMGAVRYWLGMWVGLAMLAGLAGVAAGSLESEFKQPAAQEYGLRCWWWWLNSNVDKAAITRDLEAMKAKGFSGAMIFDASGADQGNNAKVPAGPLYGSPEWIELFKHALNEAERLGLELGLSIQSGWNLGGPNVTPDYAAKAVTWSEVTVTGPGEIKQALPMPRQGQNFYRDICVLAWPVKDRSGEGRTVAVKASSAQGEFPATNALDGSSETFWVSKGTEEGQGPGSGRTEWLELDLGDEVAINRVQIAGRTGYGPKAGKVLVGKGGDLKEVAVFKSADGSPIDVRFGATKARTVRLVFEESYDGRYPQAPRNVQVTGVQIYDSTGQGLAGHGPRQPIRDLPLKAAFREGSFAAPDCRFLLDDVAGEPGEEDTALADIVNLTGKMSSDGTLSWQAPAGRWQVMRLGYTCTGSHVSTSSGGWQGLTIDYLSKAAFMRYWNEVVEPIFAAGGNQIGTTLKQLETDSWECGGMNWTDDFAAEFQRYCGYDVIPYLPVVAGKIVESREASNAFLADFRKTIADCIANNHYGTFAKVAHARNLQIQPESGGPHSGPLDAIKNLGRSDIIMGEFWAPSPHRPTPEARFYCKQAASVAHVYGKKLVAAEAFTTIGPHWNDLLWYGQKPSMDHEFCAGLNFIFLHTFTCSPPKMGTPGQEYFAGTHINPQVTWWDYSDPFFAYINRNQYLLRQGEFVADALYYLGDHVPNLMRLKSADPAGVMPGYDYDAMTEEIMLQLRVEQSRVVVPGGVSYALLVLPGHKVLSLAALEQVGELVKAGATVLGPKPERLVSRVGGAVAQARFATLANELWGAGEAGQKRIGKGLLVWGKPARTVLAEMKIGPDFTASGLEKTEDLDYIHYRLGKGHLYFVSNQTNHELDAVCSLRVTGLQPELWQALDGSNRVATAFRQQGGRTEVPVRFAPYGSYYIVLREPIPAGRQGGGKNYADLEPALTLAGPWQVSFDPKWGGPAEPVRFDGLTSWSDNELDGVKYYSGQAVYRKQFDFQPAPGARYCLELGEVRDVGFAQVRLNGVDLGITWTGPHRVDLAGALRPGTNRLEVTVINSWWNRVLGDVSLPEEKRLTRTNINLRPDWKLERVGLLGPVRVLKEQ